MADDSIFEDVDIETDADALKQTVYDLIKANIDGWQEFPGNLETFLTDGFCEVAAEVRDVAADVPKGIFRYFGSSVVALPPIEATVATVTSTWTLRDTDGHTIPAGTVVGIQSPGTDPIAFETVEDVTVANGSDTTGTGEVILNAVLAGSDANGLNGDVQLLQALDFVDSIALVGDTGGGSDAETDVNYLNRLVALCQTFAPRPILPGDFATFARNADPDVYRALAVDGFNPTNNLLTANQSNLETGLTGWVGAGTNCTATQSATVAAEGTKSLRLSSTAGGDMSTTTTTGLGGVPVDAGQEYTARAESRAGASARTFKTSIHWYDSGGAAISTSESAGVSNSTSAWTEDDVTAIAPSNAAFAAMGVKVVAAGAGSELHYFDRNQLRFGTTDDWIIGGTYAEDNERMIAIAGVTSAGVAIGSTSKAAVLADLESRRELTFIVNSLDPRITAVDVQVAATTFTGFDTDAVEESVTAAIQAFLDPASWGGVPLGEPRSWILTDRVRYGELYTAIMRVEGLRYITSLELRIGANAYATSDVILPGGAPLASAGTIAVAVTIP